MQVALFLALGWCAIFYFFFMANPKEYEVYCVDTIITHLSTYFTTSKRYCETAVRTFLRSEEPLAFNNAEAALRNCNWEALDAGTSITIKLILYLKFIV